MADEKPQNFKNHAKLVPAFHFFVLPVFMVYLVSTLIHLRFGVTFASVLSVFMAFAFVVLALCARTFALKVQDRIIRLEMQIRMSLLLPDGLSERIGEFTVGQLIALRFAGNKELPVLARQVLDEKLTDRKVIKQRIKDWQGDYLRA